jgi:O-antigen ligase
MDMETTAPTRVLSKILLTTLIFVTLFVSPWNSVDPVNLPKMAALGVLSFTLLGLLVSRKSSFLRNFDMKLGILVVIFLSQLFLTSLFNAGNLAFKIYGTPNRNTGFLTYFSLVILMIAAASIGKTTFSMQFIQALIGTSLLVSIYGLAQWQGLELFQYVNVYGNNVFSTLGNTNFHSAFMGIAGSAIFALTFAGSFGLKTRLMLVCAFLLCTLNIFLSSSQGFLSLAAGCAVSLILYLLSNKRYLIGTALSGFASIGASLVTLAVFNVGPLAEVIYEDSIKARGFYWSAGLQMLKEHPFFGVGIDGFGDWYLRSRSQSAAEFNTGLVSDSAHNIPLDLATSGGFPLLLAYLGMQALVVRRLFQNVRLGRGIDPFFLSIIAAWFAYQIQSLISINQIGLGIWGWTMSGLLIGYGTWEKNKTLTKPVRAKKTSSLTHQKLSNESFIFSVVGLVLGTMAALPPYVAANRFYQAMQSGRIEQLIESVELIPADRSRYFYVSQILMENDFQKEAIPILLKASLKYPDYFPIWSKLAENPKASPDQVAKAKLELQRLDPLNPKFK